MSNTPHSNRHTGNNHVQLRDGPTLIVLYSSGILEESHSKIDVVKDVVKVQSRTRLNPAKPGDRTPVEDRQYFGIGIDFGLHTETCGPSSAALIQDNFDTTSTKFRHVCQTNRFDRHCAPLIHDPTNEAIPRWVRGLFLGEFHLKRRC